jgi:hypothetical protein
MASNAKAAADEPAYARLCYAIIPRIPLPHVAPDCPFHRLCVLDHPRCLACLVSPRCPHARPPALALDNGAAPLPPMGMSTWDAFGFNVSSQKLMEWADKMVGL